MEQATQEPRATTLLADRYGKTPRDKRSQRRLFWVAVAAFAVVLVGWVVWAGLDSTTSELLVEDKAHSIVDDRTVDVGFAVSVTPGTPVTCAIQALDDTFAIVGWKVVEYDGSDSYTTNRVERLRTTQLAATGLISRCWLS